MTPNHVYHLIDGVLDEGLAFVAGYVENSIKHSVIIADHDGHIYYPDENRSSQEVDDIFVPIPANLAGRDFYYHPGNGCLYYRVRYNGTSAFIIAEAVPVEQISQALSVLMETKLAIKCHFCKLHKENSRFEQELTEYLFANSNASIHDIARLSENRLEMERSYFITLAEPEQISPNADMQAVRSHFHEYLKKYKLEAIPLSCGNIIAMIVPVGANQERLNEAIDRSAMVSYKSVAEKRFNLSLAQGVGGVYPLVDLHKGFYEARVALTLPRLLGKRGFVQKFSELGLYYPLFSQSQEDIKNFCRQTLGKIIEYDNKTEGELLPTLRKLLDSSLNMKHTADSLFIHVNTLYYRINKIEELLKIDFANMDSRVNLFIAIKVWDTLQISGLAY